jgi:hypothetical protein
MAIDPEDWISVEQAMEEQNHILLQAELTANNNNPNF